jgi:glyoxylase-like metal-dependent hydrolase (beta-lactamase superfamily II)
MRTICIAAAISVSAVGVLATQLSSQARAGEGGIDVLQVRPNFYMLVGAGGNIAVQVGVDGAVVVDAGSAARAAAVVETIRKLSAGPIRYVINTSADADHVGGNEIVARAGQNLFTAPDPTGAGPAGAAILSAHNVLARMSAPTGQKAPFAEGAWPTETFDRGRKYMYLNGEGIEVFHLPAAHTDGDAIVFFRRSDVVVAGDIFDTERFPVIEVARGGSVEGEIAALNRLVELAIPSIPIVSREEGTWVVPGHGRLSDQLDVVQYRDMVTIVRDRVRDLVKAGMTLEQVKATSPARGYTQRYGASSGSWTPDDFVEAVYRSLAAPRGEKS